MKVEFTEQDIEMMKYIVDELYRHLDNHDVDVYYRPVLNKIVGENYESEFQKE